MITKKLFKIPIYDWYLEVIVFDKFSDLKSTKYWSKIKDKYEPRGGFYGLTIDYRDATKNAILIQRNSLDTLVHELVHVKNNLFKHHGLEYVDEHEAYLMGWLFNNTMKLVSKKLK